MAGVETPFYFVDYLVFVISIVISVSIGIYHALSGGKQRTTSEYFVGNRKMTILPVAISLMVSFESSITMLGTPAETYVYGFQWMIGNIGFLVADLMSPFIMAPLIHPLKITSAYEYLELRFESHAIRLLGTVLGIITNVMYMGIVLFGPATAVEAVLGVPLWISILLIAFAAIVYTSIGGFKAVIWTDVFQSIIMFMGMLAVIIKGTMIVGGVKRTWEIANDNGRINMLKFDPDPTIRHTFWNLFIGSMIRGIGLSFNQQTAQRVGSMPTVGQAKKVLLLTAPGHFIVLSLAAIEGIIAYAYFDTIGCDPLASKQVNNPNQVIPYMVVDIFRNLHGMSGIFMASLLCASLSTLSSGLSSLSSLFWTDIVKPHVKPMSELKATLISKASVIGFGVIAVLISFMISLIGGTLMQIAGSVLSAFGGPLTGLFMFGAFCPWGNSKGAFIATIVSTVVVVTLTTGQTLTKGAVRSVRLPSGPTDLCYTDEVLNSTLTTFTMSVLSTETLTTMASSLPEPTGISRLFMVSYQWFATIGILLVIILGTIISLLTGYKKPGEVEEKYLISLGDTFFPFLPKSIRNVFKCGYHKSSIEKYPMVKTTENGFVEVQTSTPDTKKNESVEKQSSVTTIAEKIPMESPPVNGVNGL